MNYFSDIKVVMKEKSWKKLTFFSVFVLLITTAIVFIAVFELSKNYFLNQMDEYLDEIPNIISVYENELQNRGRIYEEDGLTRAELGLKLFTEENERTDEEKLEYVRSSVSAESVSLLDGSRQVLATTGPVSPEESFNAALKSLEPMKAHVELYPALVKDGAETDENDGKGFVLIPLQGNTNRSLVFEFSCEAILKLYNDIYGWTNILERLIYKIDDASAFALTGDKLVGYPLNNYTPEQISQLYEEVMDVFRNSSSFRHSVKGVSNKVVRLLGNRYLVALVNYAPENTDILLMYPLSTIVRNVLFIAAAVSAIIGWGIILVRLYIFRCLCRNKDDKKGKRISQKQVWKETWPGILIVVLVTILFSYMLLILEIRTEAAYTAANKRKILQSDIDYRRNQEKTIRSTYVNFYRSRAQILADYLMEHPDQQTKAGLEELNRIAGTDYLMRFDSTGLELVASNSYTGFAVGENLSDEYRAVLLGYPDVIVGPETDPYTGKIQLSTAIMMTDDEGQPDGFLLVVYNAGALEAELKQVSYENTVNSFTVQKNQIAAAVSDSDGRFIAHTDPQMIGQKASDYLEGFEIGSSFEGFNSYTGKDMCISANAMDGKTLLFMVPERWNSYEDTGSLPLILAVIVLLILSLLYYPTASVLIARSIKEAEKNLRTDDGKKNSIKVFFDGYDIFLTLFALFVLIASSNGWWSSFDYVLSGKWSKGLNLFAVWASLLILVSTLFFVLLIRIGLSILENHLSLRSRTITSLIRSIVSYSAVIFLIFAILDLLGVNTTALLASAGILSIAIGMGAKSMAEDLLAGFFMMTEGTVRVGDRVSFGRVSGASADITGIVTNMGIRTTEITDDQGNVVTLNNSKVTHVRNMNRNLPQQEPESSGKKGS